MGVVKLVVKRDSVGKGDVGAEGSRREVSKGVRTCGRAQALLLILEMVVRWRRRRGGRRMRGRVVLLHDELLSAFIVRKNQFRRGPCRGRWASQRAHASTLTLAADKSTSSRRGDGGASTWRKREASASMAAS